MFSPFPRRSLRLFLFFFLALTPVDFRPRLYAETQPGLSNEELLNTIQERSFQYFLLEPDSRTGLVPDRASNVRKGNLKAPATIAGTGFALTAYPVGVKRDWMDDATAKERTRTVLDFFLNHAPHERGFFYHYLDPKTGKRVKQSEISPIDTSLLLAGILFAAEYFEDAKITEMAQKIYERVDWNWMLNGGKTLALNWTPEDGFHKLRWDHYDESMIMYLLAIGSPTHPIPPKSWHAIARPVGSYKEYRLIQMPPLFTHQYSHIWVDFRDQNDGYADYFKNSINATLANRAFAMDQASRYESYGPNSWGLTASNGPFGYRAYGAPPGWAVHDGTIAPTGCGSSIVFTPEKSLTCLRYFYEELGDKIWGRYGFSDAFNLDKKWFDDQVNAIDQGALLLMIENYRSELIWKIMKKNTAIQNAMQAVGFTKGTLDLNWQDPPEHYVDYIAGGIEVDGFLKDWSKQAVLHLNMDHKELGEIEDEQDLSGELRFAWDEEALYFAAKVTDDNLVLRKTKKNIWMDDCLELYFDPQGDGLYWNHESDFQIGLRPDAGTSDVHIWSWFQGGDDPSAQAKIIAKGFTDEKGYIIEGAIRWTLLGIQPFEGAEVGFSPALHDMDQDRSQGKLQWFFRHEKGFQRFTLGRLILKREWSGVILKEEPESLHETV